MKLTKTMKTHNISKRERHDDDIARRRRRNEGVLWCGTEKERRSIYKGTGKMVALGWPHIYCSKREIGSKIELIPRITFNMEILCFVIPLHDLFGSLSPSRFIIISLE